MNTTRRPRFDEVRKELSSILEVATSTEFYLDITHVADGISQNSDEELSTS